MHLDISSALRTHPLELIASFAFMIPIVVVCGLSQVVLAVYETVEVFANMLTHANVRLPRAVERHARALLVTPGLHRLHHSAFQPDTDSNYGNVFSFWIGCSALCAAKRARPVRRSVSALTTSIASAQATSSGNWSCHFGNDVRTPAGRAAAWLRPHRRRNHPRVCKHWNR